MPPRSKIAQLPEEFRRWLHEALVERSFGDIVDLTAELNAKFKAAGIATFIGKSAVGAESQKLKRAAESIRAATEAAKLIADSARDDADARGEALNAILSTQLFEVMLQIGEAKDIEDPLERAEALAKIAKAIAPLQNSRIAQSKWRLELETKVKAAADQISGIAKASGLSAEAVAAIRERVLGITKAA